MEISGFGGFGVTGGWGVFIRESCLHMPLSSNSPPPFFFLSVQNLMASMALTTAARFASGSLACARATSTKRWLT